MFIRSSNKVDLSMFMLRSLLCMADATFISYNKVYLNIFQPPFSVVFIRSVTCYCDAPAHTHTSQTPRAILHAFSAPPLRSALSSLIGKVKHVVTHSASVAQLLFFAESGEPDEFITVTLSSIHMSFCCPTLRNNWGCRNQQT